MGPPGGYPVRADFVDAATAAAVDGANRRTDGRAFSTPPKKGPGEPSEKGAREPMEKGRWESMEKGGHLPAGLKYDASRLASACAGRVARGPVRRARGNAGGVLGGHARAVLFG
jgi:hypothetical protein